MLILHVWPFGSNLIFERSSRFFLSILSTSKRLFIILIHETDHFHRFDIQWVKHFWAVHHLFRNRAIFQVIAGLTFYIFITRVLFSFILCWTKWCSVWRSWLFRCVINWSIFVCGVVLSWWNYLSVKFLYFLRHSTCLLGDWFASCVRGVWRH